MFYDNFATDHWTPKREGPFGSKFFLKILLVIILQIVDILNTITKITHPDHKTFKNFELPTYLFPTVYINISCVNFQVIYYWIWDEESNFPVDEQKWHEFPSLRWTLFT